MTRDRGFQDDGRYPDAVSPPPFEETPHDEEAVMAALRAGRPLVLGLGNLLLGDDGVGIHAVRRLSRESLTCVPAVEAGTALLDALPLLAAARRVIALDAMAGSGEPGTIYRFKGADRMRSAQDGSMHGLDLARVLAMLPENERPEVTFLGVEPARVDYGLELSEPVAAALPRLLDLLREEVGVNEK